MTAARSLVACALAGAVLVASPLRAQTVLTGTVREDSTGRPLAGVDITVAGSVKRTITDRSGRYVLDQLPAGRRMVLFRSIGYRPVQEWVRLGSVDTVWANPMMVPGSVRLDPIVVTAKRDAPGGIGLEAFEERRRMGFGKFLDSTTLRRNEHVPLVEMLGRLQGLGFGRAPGEVGWIVAISQRRFGPMGEPCYMGVMLDGVPLFSSVAPGLGGTVSGRPPPDLKMFDVASIEAVELYRSAAEVPIEFGGAGAGCGLLVLWTRHR